MNKKQAWVLAAVLVVIGIVAALESSSSRPLPAPIPIVIARLRAPISGLVDIAIAKDYFAAEGLSATIQSPALGYDAIQAVLQGNADVGTTAETPIAKVLLEGRQLKIVGSIFNSVEDPGIVGRRDRGVIQPKDLKGKRIGIVAGTASHYLLETFLAYHRIPLEDVTLVQIKPDQLVSALVSGEVDAEAVWHPFLYQVQQQLGERAEYFSTSGIYSFNFNLVVRSDYAQLHREAIDRLLRALLKAEAFAAKHPDEAMTIIASASGTDIAALRANWNPLAYEVTLNQSLLLATESEARWILRRGFVPAGSVPDVLNAFEIEPLRALKPSGVSIVK
ncbi:ABC transporter substrate-binding protein [Azoarcus sp. KH32C]|uniref:ABC transporter substrate-binding protein n=1 Tax=Azoarcus sp. KH32C TaxID=748247 RepID=UPI0002385F88|nr:NrtA/SsuA/CpmA family ABC transporter substrate-binding protein [Azoarcus sp. KH32C]BAL22393.1 hypothetical protein AZKH_0041 [Azoarcus sp. KH32C]